MANAWFTPPGSSVLEIMPYEWVPMQPGALTSSQFNKWVSGLLWVHQYSRTGRCMGAATSAPRAALLRCFPPHNPLVLAQDPTSQLLWWVLITCDPQISEPGPEERAGGWVVVVVVCVVCVCVCGGGGGDGERPCSGTSCLQRSACV